MSQHAPRFAHGAGAAQATPAPRNDLPAPHPDAAVSTHCNAALSQQPPRLKQGLVGEHATPSPRNRFGLLHTDGPTVEHASVAALQHAPSVAPPQGFPEQLVPAPCQSPRKVLF